MSIFDFLPFWLNYLLVVGTIMLAAEAGFRLGLELHRRNVLLERDTSTGVLLGAVLGLLAFFLAFAIGFALNNYSTRRQLVVNEANAIGTAYLRASYLEGETGSEVQELFREYLAVRLSWLATGKLEDVIIRSEEIQNQIWALTEAYAVQHPESVVGGLFIEAVNEVIDLHTTRVSANQSLRIPSVGWWIIIGITVLSFLLVGIASSTDGRRNLFALTIFALAFAAAIVLLIDLDNPVAGLIGIKQNALINLQSQIGTPVP